MVFYLSMRHLEHMPGRFLQTQWAFFNVLTLCFARPWSNGPHCHSCAALFANWERAMLFSIRLFVVGVSPPWHVKNYPPGTEQSDSPAILLDSRDNRPDRELSDFCRSGLDDRFHALADRLAVVFRSWATDTQQPNPLPNMFQFCLQSYDR